MHILEWINTHRNATIGLCVGLIFGILIVVWSFWKALVVLILAAIGYGIGRFFDRGGNANASFDRLDNWFRHRGS